MVLICLAITLLRGPVGSWTAKAKVMGHNVGSLFQTIVFQLRSPAHPKINVAVTRGFVTSNANYNKSCPIGKRNNIKKCIDNAVFHLLLYCYILMTSSAAAPGNQSDAAPSYVLCPTGFLHVSFMFSDERHIYHETNDDKT